MKRSIMGRGLTEDDAKGRISGGRNSLWVKKKYFLVESVLIKLNIIIIICVRNKQLEWHGHVWILPEKRLLRKVWNRFRRVRTKRSL